MSLQIPTASQPVTTPAGVMTREWFKPLSRIFQLMAMIGAGPGDPTGVVTMTRGSLWLRTDGGAGTTLYVQEGDTSASWDAK